MVDATAKGALQLGAQTGRFATSKLPLEEVWFTKEGKKIAGCVGNVLREHWERRFARQYFAEKYVVLEDNFDLLWCKCIERTRRDWS